MQTNININNVSTDIQKFLLENYLFGFNQDEFEKDSSLLELGVLDSTGIMELVAFIENEFSIEVFDSEIIPENLDSINFICSYIGRKRNCSASICSKLV